MSTVITVENLSKAYRIGLLRDPNKTLVSDMLEWWKQPMKNFNQLRRLSNIDINEDSPDLILALKGVNLEIKDGDVVGVIGRNGAGKSTLLKILSRITKPTVGRVTFKGRVSSLLEVGTGFHPELTGRENIYLNGTILGMSKVEVDRKFDEIVDFSGVEQFLDTPIKRYSSGMSVRLAFAVAAHMEPEILIIDEVLAVGDLSFQKKCLGKMKDVASKGRTVLFTSHNMAAVNSLCTRAFMLHKGEKVFEGSTMDTIQEYYRINSGGEKHCRAVFEPEESKAAWLTRATLTSNGEFHSSGYHCGAPLEFNVECEAKASTERPELFLSIDTYEGQRLVSFTTGAYEIKGFEEKVDGTFSYRCHVHDLGLAPGNYRVSLKLGSGNESQLIENAFIFDVMPGDFYGSGRTPGDTNGLILQKHGWALDCGDILGVKE